MNARELAAKILEAADKFGDLPVVGCLSDSIPATQVAVIDESGCEVWPGGNPDRKPDAIWIE